MKPGPGAMTQKERYLNTMKFKAVDRIPNMEICLWRQTYERWVREGMPADVGSGFMHGGSKYFDLEGYETVHIDATMPHPPVAERTIEENETYVVFVDGFGRTRKALKTGSVNGARMSMDTYLEFAVKDRATFKAFKRRYEGKVEERYPRDWEQAKAMARSTALPLTLLDPLSGTFGYYSMLRNWMGTEGVSYLFYDDPALIEECLEFLTNFAIGVLTKAVQEIKFDFYYIHEDMSFKNGPLVSPDLFRRMFLPQYKRFIGFLKAHGVELVLVDTDGNHEVLIPLFLEAGVDGFGPIERAADMDPVKLRQRYGKTFCMAGGVDKRAISKGKREIEEEVKRVIVPLIAQGGFIPSIDHSIPPDVSLENFRYYLKLKRQAIFGE